MKCEIVTSIYSDLLSNLDPLGQNSEGEQIMKSKIQLYKGK